MAYEDRDSAAEQIYYTVTKPLGENQGSLEHVERPFKPVRSFTQDDVNNNRIIYRPPEREIGDREMEFTFYFTGKDSVILAYQQEFMYDWLMQGNTVF